MRIVSLCCGIPFRGIHGGLHQRKILCSRQICRTACRTRGKGEHTQTDNTGSNTGLVRPRKLSCQDGLCDKREHRSVQGTTLDRKTKVCNTPKGSAKINPALAGTISTTCSAGASCGGFPSCACAVCVLQSSFFFSFLMNPCDAGFPKSMNNFVERILDDSLRAE